MNGPYLVKGKVGNRATRLHDWTVKPGPFGVMVIEGVLMPAGETWQRQLFAVTHGYAVTDAGMVRLGEGGRWVV